MIDTQNNIPLIVILGPTASGKTKLAVDLASKIEGEIISADSRQVYREMNIGTGKDYDEYLPLFKKDENSPSGIAGLHLVDILEAGESYNVAFFQRDFQKAYEDIISRKKTPILCGGTGMYIEAVLRNYENTQTPVNQEFREILEQKSNEELQELFKEKYKNIHSEADISTRKRLIRAIEIGNWKLETGMSGVLTNSIPHGILDEKKEIQNSEFRIQNSILFGISIPVEVRRERITKRLHERLNNGMIEEVKNLLEKGISAEKLIFYGLEYKLITEFIIGNLSYDEMVKRLEIAIHQFAKRQMTFFRSMEKKSLTINWLDGMKSVNDLSTEILKCIKNNKNVAF
jgi:tRNA dimethylallyltransferase